MITPIKDISTYINKFNVVAKVVRLEQPRTFTNKTGLQGKVWNVTIQDETGDEIVAKFWNAACTKFQDVLKVGNCYSFSKGKVAMANQRYSTCKHPYELVFEEDSDIKHAENVKILGSAKYNPIAGGIRAIKTSNKPLPFTVDVIGVIVSSGPIENISLKSGGSQQKRDFYIADSSNHKMKISVWREQPEIFNDQFLASNPIVALRNVSVKEYRGKTGTVQALDVEHFQSRSDTPDGVTEVMEWWENSGKSQVSSFVSISDDGTRGSITGDGSSNANVVNIPGTITLAEAFSHLESISPTEEQPYGDSKVLFMKTNAFPQRYFVTSERDGVQTLTCTYTACDGCNKKVSNDMGCMICSGSAVVEKFMLNMSLCDFSGTKFNVRCFHGQAVTLVKSTADEVQKMKGNDSQLNRIFDWESNYTPYEFTLKAENKEYSGVTRVNITVVAIAPIDENKHFDDMVEGIASNLPSLSNKKKRTSVPVEEAHKRVCTDENAAPSTVKAASQGDELPQPPTQENEAVS